MAYRTDPVNERIEQLRIALGPNVAIRRSEHSCAVVFGRPDSFAVFTLPDDEILHANFQPLVETIMERLGIPIPEPVKQVEPQGFGWALHGLRNGGKVRRAGWNDKGMHLELATNGRFYRDPGDGLGQAGEKLEPFIVMWTAQKTWVPWLASQADVLATDWELAQ